MKIAVDRRRVDLHPELVDGLGRLRDVAAASTSWCCGPRRPIGSSSSAASAGGSSPGTASAAAVTTTDSSTPRAGRGRRRAAAAARRRPGRARTRTRPGRWSAAASGRRPPAPAVSPRPCGRSRSSLDIAEQVPRRSARTPGSSTSPTRSASSRGPCCRRVTGRSACATSPSASSAASPDCSTSAPDAVQLDHVGLNHLTWERAARGVGRPSTVLPELLAASTATQIAERHRAARAAAAPARRRAVVLPALLLRPRRGGARAADRAESRAAAGRGDRARAARACTRTRRSTASRRCSPQRGGAYYSEAAVQLPGGAARQRRRSGDPGRQRPQRRHPARSCPTTPSSRSPRDGRPRGVRAAAGRAAARRCTPGWSRTSRRTSTWRSTPRCTAAATGSSQALLAHPLVGQVDRADGLTDRLIAHNRGPPAVGLTLTRARRRRASSRSTRGNSKTDVALRRADGDGARHRPRSGPFQPAPWSVPRPPSRAGRDRPVARGRRSQPPATTGRSCATSPPASPTPTSRSSTRRLDDARRRARLGRASAGLQRHLRPAARRPRRAARRRRGLRRRHQLRRVCCRTARTVRFAARRPHLRRLGRRRGPGGRRRMWWAARAEDGRGPATALARRPPRALRPRHGDDR